MHRVNRTAPTGRTGGPTRSAPPSRNGSAKQPRPGAQASALGRSGGRAPRADDEEESPQRTYRPGEVVVVRAQPVQGDITYAGDDDASSSDAEY